MNTIRDMLRSASSAQSAVDDTFRAIRRQAGSFEGIYGTQETFRLMKHEQTRALESAMGISGISDQLNTAQALSASMQGTINALGLGNAHKTVFQALDEVASLHTLPLLGVTKAHRELARHLENPLSELLQISDNLSDQINSIHALGSNTIGNLDLGEAYKSISQALAGIASLDTSSILSAASVRNELNRQFVQQRKDLLNSISGISAIETQIAAGLNSYVDQHIGLTSVASSARELFESAQSKLQTNVAQSAEFISAISKAHDLRSLQTNVLTLAETISASNKLFLKELANNALFESLDKDSRAIFSHTSNVVALSEFAAARIKHSASDFVGNSQSKLRLKKSTRIRRGRSRVRNELKVVPIPKFTNLSNVPTVRHLTAETDVNPGQIQPPNLRAPEAKSVGAMQPMGKSWFELLGIWSAIASLPFAIFAIKIASASLDYDRASYELAQRADARQSKLVVAAPTIFGFVVAENVNLRFGPSTKQKVLLRLDRGEFIEIIKKRANWCQIVRTSSTGTLIGWVHQRYIQTLDAEIENVAAALKKQSKSLSVP